MSDCLIIGGGVIGMLTALELARKGMQVRLLERNSMGQESSWAGGGILSPLYPWRYSSPVSLLARWGQQHFADFFNELAQSTHIDPEYKRDGLLILDTANEAEQARAWAEQYRIDMHYIDAEQTRAREPRLQNPQAQHAFWFPQIGQVRNPRLGQALQESLRQNGVHIEENTLVQELLLEGRKVSGVTTLDGDIHADRVILCAGAWSAVLLKRLAITLEVKPVRGQMLLFKTEPDFLQRIVLADGRYLIPRKDGHVLVGSTLEQSGFDKSTTRAAYEDLYQSALRLVPELKSYAIIKHWAGLRPGTPTGIPYIGPHPDIDGLYLNTGHFRNGIVLSLASTRLLRNLVIGETPIIDPEPYSFSALSRLPSDGEWF